MKLCDYTGMKGEVALSWVIVSVSSAGLMEGVTHF
jgi:hypothetical protein